MRGDEQQVKILLDDTPELARARGATGETPLHHAAALGGAALIDLLLADKADIDAQETNRFGGTPLHWAVRSGRIDAARHLVGRGADPKSVNARTGQTLLHVAARQKAAEPMRAWLATLGIDAAIKDRFGKTAGDYE